MNIVYEYLTLNNITNDSFEIFCFDKFKTTIEKYDSHYFKITIYTKGNNMSFQVRTEFYIFENRVSKYSMYHFFKEIYNHYALVRFIGYVINYGKEY